MNDKQQKLCDDLDKIIDILDEKTEGDSAHADAEARPEPLTDARLNELVQIEIESIELGMEGDAADNLTADQLTIYLTSLAHQVRQEAETALKAQACWICQDSKLAAEAEVAALKAQIRELLKTVDAAVNRGLDEAGNLAWGTPEYAAALGAVKIHKTVADKLRELSALTAAEPKP